tara:strand:+ start:23000 stop:23188 length:189 start_codon:yes stop_codon:yes gene_type:complete
MKKYQIITIVAILLFLLAMFNLIRVFYGWKLTIHLIEVPMWTSILFGIIFLILSKKILEVKK